MIRTAAVTGVLAMAALATVAACGAAPVGPATTQTAKVGGAASQPAGRATLPVEFEVLQRRNVFAHGPGRGGPGAAAAGPEGMMVLKGVVEAGGRFMAFVEDKGSKRVETVTEGATLASGRITGMNLDGIEYQAGGSAAKRIAVGQNLRGEVVPPTPTSKPAAPGAVPGGPGVPGRPGGPPGQPPGQPAARAVPASGPVPVMVRPGG
jgi:hypothetical protein